MVCLACLLPLYLVPIVNVLPILVDYIMAKVCGVFGWEYRKPVRVPPSCPYKPPAATALKNKDPKTEVQEESVAPHPVGRPSEIDCAVDVIVKDKVVEVAPHLAVDINNCDL